MGTGSPTSRPDSFKQLIIKGMKKLLSIFAIICLGIIMSGCDNEGGYTSISWEECAVSYSILNYFPTYDGDIENAAYFDDNDGESVMFCDFDVKRDNVDTFRSRLSSAGFIAEETSNTQTVYTSITGTYNLRVIIDDFETYVIIELTVMA